LQGAGLHTGRAALPWFVGADVMKHWLHDQLHALRRTQGRPQGQARGRPATPPRSDAGAPPATARSRPVPPASLVGQWRDEMAAKFGIECATSHDALFRSDPKRFWAQPRVIASIAAARRKDHAELLATLKYDVVVVDEAHHLRDQASASYRLVNSLRKRFLLLLSATPVQNNLIELYNLLTLLQPGIFKTPREFRAAYMVPGKPREPANRERLRDLMRGVMVRNTRALAALRLARSCRPRAGAGHGRRLSCQRSGQLRAQFQRPALEPWAPRHPGAIAGPAVQAKLGNAPPASASFLAHQLLRCPWVWATCHLHSCFLSSFLFGSAPSPWMLCPHGACA